MEMIQTNRNMTLDRRRREKKWVLCYKTHFLLAKNTISALFSSKNHEKIPAFGRIMEIMFIIRGNDTNDTTGVNGRIYL